MSPERTSDHNKKMEACLAVEREIEKVLGKFNDIDRHAINTLQDLLNHVQGIKQDLGEGTGSFSLSVVACFVTPFLPKLNFE